MGLTLTRAAQWAAASSGTGGLEPTPINESLLKEILRFAEPFGSQHPREAALVFEEPLCWSTTLAASDFQADYDISDSAAQSREKDSEGRPLLQLSPPTVSVRSFSQLSELLHLAQDKQLEEVRACLEENRDLMVKILGRSFDTISETEDAQTDFKRLAERIKEEDPAKDPGVTIELFVLLQNEDKRIVSRLLEEISQKVRLDPAAVKNEARLLERLCSLREDKALKSLRYTSEFEFPNGCRSPPWRQLHGETCYLVVEPFDTDTLHVTCCSDGVFLNALEWATYEKIVQQFQR